MLAIVVVVEIDRNSIVRFEEDHLSFDYLREIIQWYL